MKNIKLILLLFALLVAIDMEAQNLHFSQFQLTPLMVNPALTGGFNGTARINAINRGQWWSVAGGNPLSGNGYNSMVISIDAPVIRGLRKQDWVGVGVGFILLDKAGAGDYGASGSTAFSAAYHLGLDKKQRSVLSIGIQNASLGYSLTNNFDFVSRPGLINSSVPGYLDQDIEQLFSNADENFKINGSASDWVLGLVLTAPLGKNADMRFGASMSHIFTPDKSVATGGNIRGRDELPRKLTVFAQLYNSLSDRFLFKPGFVVQKQGATTEIQVQGMGSYLFNTEKDVWLNFGLGLRPMNSTDLILFLGADIKDIRIGLSYDVNFSGFTAATNNNGALELGISYIWKYYKKPKVDPVMVCPRL